jgi:phosphatidylglycerol:prolipoprotein diacylglycerol transferase
MLQTLFHIPERIFGWPTFGVGVLLAVWAVASLVLLAWLVRRHGWNADTRSYVPLLAALGAVIWLLLPRISEPGLGLPIRGYGTMLLIAVVSGAALAAWRGYRLGIDPELTITLIFWGFVPGIIGARVYYVVTHSGEFHTLGEIVNVTQGGLVVYGALIGGMLGFAAFFIKERLPPLPMLDILTPGMLLGLALGRVGCFLNGCCYGGVCDLPWAVRFPVGSPPFVQQLEEGRISLYGLKLQGPDDAAPVIAEVEPRSPADERGLKPGQTLTSINGTPVATVSHARWALFNAHRFGDEIAIAVAGNPRPVRLPIPVPAPRTEPIHPTQLYSALDALVLCIFLLAYDPFKRRDGEVLALFLTIYPVNRFLMECIRTDEPGIWGTPLTGAQFLSLAILAGVSGLWWHLLRKPPGKAFPLAAAS